jgi:hypothetical protein
MALEWTYEDADRIVITRGDRKQRVARAHLFGTSSDARSLRHSAENFDVKCPAGGGKKTSDVPSVVVSVRTR